MPNPVLGSAGAVPGPLWVRPTYVFAGLIMPTGPSGARFSTGMMISAHPELNVPITPIRLLSCA